MAIQTFVFLSDVDIIINIIIIIITTITITITYIIIVIVPQSELASVGVLADVGKRAGLAPSPIWVARVGARPPQTR